MSKIEDIVDSLENKISKVLHKLEVLKQTNTKLSQDLAMQQQKHFQQQEEISSWVEKYESLKMANSLLGSNENNKETKLKINALIRDIDHCIAQLSE
jgi:F0F1-type ATP synthase beta subunit